MLKEEKTNLLKRIIFLDSERHSLLEKNNGLTQEIKSNKPSSSMNEIFTLELKCLMKCLINAKLMAINEVWGALIKMKLPLMEKLCLSKVKMKPLIEHHLVKIHHYAHTTRKLKTLNSYARLGF